jgi:hypothetical protein
MTSTLLLSAALLAPAAPIPASAPSGNPGPAPRVFALKADASGAVRIIATTPTRITVTQTHFVIEQVMVNGAPQQQQVQKQVEQDVVSSTYLNKALSEFQGKFSTAGGLALTVEEAVARVKGGATLLASADGKPVGKQWLAAVSPDTVVMVAEGLEKAQQQYGGGILPTTPGPRLAMIGTDDAGKPVAQCTDNPLNNNGYVYYGDNIIFEGKVRAWGGRGGIYYGNQQQYEGKVITKSLADVPFEAYDRAGKLVPRATALKRLVAGGMVVVAGNNMLPDENYLKAFKEDVLVLVGADLVLPVTPIDQTKKRDPNKKEDPMAQPQPPVKLLPGLRPAIQPAIAPAVIKRAQVQIAPAVEAVPAQKEEAKPAKEEKK